MSWLGTVQRRHWRRLEVVIWGLLVILPTRVLGQGPTGGGVGPGGAGAELWPLERPPGMTAIQSLEVMCGKEHMDVHLKFTSPFDGLVFSKGQYGDPRCVYVAPRGGGSGTADPAKTHFTFRIAYRRCGTKPDLHGQFYENTVVIQYDRDLLEVWDEAKRLRCEWFNDYEKTASKPPMVISDLDVIQLDFRGDNVDCWMEIQHGKGPWAPPVSGIVPLGSTLTLVVAINDHRGEFDMRVKSCSASDGGGGHVIQLSDEHGCVLRPKMISRFQKTRSLDDRASVITYAFFHAFKFPDAISVHIDCKVEICRRGCQEHCFAPGPGPAVHNGRPGGPGGHGPVFNGYRHGGPVLERREDPAQLTPPRKPVMGREGEDVEGDFLDDLGDDEVAAAGVHAVSDNLDRFPHSPHEVFHAPPRPKHRDGQPRIPYGPRNLATKELPPPPQPSATSVNAAIQLNDSETVSVRPGRRVRRFAAKPGSSAEDVGVSGLYEVISETDLAFAVDTRPEAVEIFQGRRQGEGDVVYGICMPVQSLGALFVVLGAITIAAALFAGTLFHRYQRQQESQRLSAWFAIRSLLSFGPPSIPHPGPVVQFTANKEQ